MGNGAKRADTTGVSRRNVMRGASMAGLAAVAALGHETPAMADGLSGAFAKAPSGGDDSALLKDAAAYGKILGPGCYRVSQAAAITDLSMIATVGIPGVTAIQVEGEAFIDADGGWNQILVNGIDFECVPNPGSTVIRNRSTNPNVTRHKIVRDCFFHNYTGAAISLNQSDNPYIKIDGCTFSGKSSVGTAGVALAAGNDETLISNCDFLVNQNDIVLGSGGSRVRVRDCEFVHFDKGTNRVNIWIQPSPGYVNSGTGLAISDNKFGNENRDGSDFYVLYADSGSALRSGARYIGEFGPAQRVSSGWASLQRIQHNDISGAGDTTRPTVISWTPNIIGSLIGPNFHSGTIPAFELYFAGGAVPTSNTGTRVDAGTNQNPTSSKPLTNPSNASDSYVRKLW